MGGVQPSSMAKASLRQRGKAISGAGGVGNNVVPSAIVFALVHAHDDGDVVVLGGGGDDDLFRASDQVPLGLFAVGEQAGGFDDHFNPQRLPRKIRRVLGADDLYLLAVDDEDIILEAVRGGFP